jgi:hypothetical protein
MRVRRTEHTAHFTVMPNAVLRHPRLSLAARGLLGHLLSLPDGSRETVASIAEKVSEGRVTVRKAMAQLETEGFVKRVRRQDAESGLWTTEVTVSDVPLTELPTDRIPTVGAPAPRSLGRSPYGSKNPVEEPTPTPEPAEAPKGAEEGRGDASQQQEEHSPEIGRAAAVLGRLGGHEAKLTLSATEALSLAPLAAQWLSRGVSELEIRNVLTAGLPAAVHAPAKLVANRLQRKLPAARRAADPAAPAVATRAECDGCARPLPLGQHAGTCAACAGTVASSAAPVDVTDWRNASARPGVISAASGRAKVRAAMAGI